MRGSFVSAGQTMMETGRSMTIVSAGALALGAAAVKVGIDYESAFAGVRKTVNATEPEFAALSAGIRQMALEVPASAASIASVAEAAGQLGVETPNILGFTRTMVDLGVSTNMSAEQAATSLARLANITQMPQTEFGRLGSVVVALGNNFATTESEIVEMGLRIAGAGHTVGMTEPQIMGFAAALSSVGVEAQAGGSAISRVMIDMASEVSAGGAKLETFATVAGMTGAEFQRAFKEDAAGAIISFIEGLGGIQAAGGDVFGVLDELGLSEIRVRDALLRAAGAGTLFSDAIKLGSEAWVENTALTHEASERYKTTASQLQILKNNLVEVGISLGATLLPMLNQVVSGLQTLTGFISGSVVPAFNALPGPVKTFGVVLVGLLAVAGPLLVVFGMLAVAIGAISTPVLLVVAGGAALIALLVALEAHTGALSAAWGLLKSAFEGGKFIFDSVKEWFSGLSDLIKKAVESIALGGKAIALVLAGDFGGAVKAAQDSMKVWADSTQEETARATGAVTSAAKESRAAWADWVAGQNKAYDEAQKGRSKDEAEFNEWLNSRSTKIRSNEATVVWNMSDRSMQLSRTKLQEALETVLAEASAEVGKNVTLKDLEAGYINVWDAEAGARSVSLQKYIDMVGLLASGVKFAGKAAQEASDDYTAFGEGLYYTQAESAALVARTTALGTAMAGMGGDVGAAFTLVSQAVSSGMTTAGGAIDAFVANGQIRFSDFRATAETEMQKARVALAEALAAPEPDPQAIAGIQGYIDTLTRIVEAGTARAGEFGKALDPVIEAYKNLGQAAAEAGNRMSEWESKGKQAGTAIDILDQQLADGRITTDQYNESKAKLVWLQERATGGALDEGNAYVDATVKTAEYTQKLDDLNSKYADKNSSEYRLALAALTAQYDPASAAGLTMADTLGNLAKSMDTTIEKIVNLLVQLGIFDQTQAEAVLGVKAEDAETGTQEAKDSAQEFADAEYKATLEADTGGAIDATKDAADKAAEYAGGTYEAALAADPSDAKTKSGAATDAARAFANGNYVGVLAAENSQALEAIGAVQTAVDNLPKNFTIYAELNYTAIEAGMVRVAGLIPHSPAKWGPLAFTPDWGYITEGFADDTLPAVQTGVGTIRGALGIDGQPLGMSLGAGYAAGITGSTPAITAAAVDASEAASEGVVLGMVDARRFQGETFLRELNDFAAFVVDIVSESAGQFEDGMLTAAKGYMDAAKSAFELFQQALDLIGALDASNASLQHAVQAATDLATLTEHIVLSAGDSVALIDASRPEGFLSRAGEYADAAGKGVDLMQSGVDLLAALDGVASDLGRAKDAASQVKFLTEHVMLSIGDSARYLDAERGASFTEAATAYADASEKGIDLMERGAALMATLSGLSGDLGRAQDAASQVKFLTEHIVLSIGDSADYIAATRGGGFVERARAYAEAATAGLALMTEAATALGSLGLLAQADFIVANDAASQVKFLTEHIVASLGDSAALFSTGGLEHLQAYLTAATAALALMSSVVSAVEAIFDFASLAKGGVDLYTQAARMVELTEYVVRQMQLSASMFSSAGLAAVSEYSGAASAAMDTMGKAGDALEAILMFSTIQTGNRDLVGIAASMVALIDLIIQQIGTVAAHWNTAGLEAVSAFSKGANDGLQVMATAGEALKAILLYGDLDPSTRENLRQLAWEMTGVADYILDMLRQIARNYSTDALESLGAFASVAGQLLGLVKTAADAFKAMVDHSRVTQQHADAFLSSWEIVIDLVQRVAELASTQGVQDALRFLSAVEEIAALIQAANATIQAVQPAALPSVPGGATGATTAPNTGATTTNQPPASGGQGTGNYGDPSPKWNPPPVGTESTITRAAKGIDLPPLAAGGVVTREIAARVGEAGFEAVIPLEDAGAGIVAKALVAEMLRSPEWVRLDRLPLGSFSADMTAYQAGGDDIAINFNSPVTINARDRGDAERSVEDVGWGIRAAIRRKGLAT
ncbi:MAG TPA: phage tail tape measure protein [Chloroflexi bacterium]|nr:phage tail tape measure protein [Chloroflexota bacterium]HCG29351.1 phage tail tape measure protein [Chloroflexota bacterium]